MAKFLTRKSSDSLTLANVKLHLSETLSGLTNGTEYVAYRLLGPSPAFTPATGSVSGLTPTSSGYLVAPVANDGTLTNAALFTNGSFTGLIDGTAYYAYAISPASDAFVPQREIVPQTFVFGDRNAIGEGAVAISDVEDGSYAPFVVAAGMLSPAQALTAGTYAVGPHEVVVESSSRVLSTASEITAILSAAVANRSGVRHKLRPGNYDLLSFDFVGKQAHTTLPYTWESLDVDDRATLNNWAVGSLSAQQGNFTLRSLNFYRPQNSLNHPWSAPDFYTSAIINIDGPYSSTGNQAGTINVIVEDCDIWSDMNPAQAGGRMIEVLNGINVNIWSDGVKIRNNRVHHVANGVIGRGKSVQIIGNTITHCHADSIDIQSGAAGARIEGNRMGIPIGDQNILHPDLGAQYQPNGAYSAQGIRIRGNVTLIGEGLNLGRSVARETGFFPGVSLSGTVALTVADHAHRDLTWVAGASATLPAAADAKGFAFFFRRSGSPGAITINAQSGEESGIFPLSFNGAGALTNTACYAAWSDGTQWRTHVRGLRGWCTYHEGDWTLHAVDDARCMYVNATEDSTLTLSADAGSFGVELFESTGHALTIVPGSGQTMTVDGVAVTELVLTTARQVFSFTRSGTVWAAVSGSMTIQGYYGNWDGLTSGLGLVANLMIGTAVNGLKFEDHLGSTPKEVVGMTVAWNTIVKEYGGSSPRSGLDGWSTNTPTTNAYVRGTSNLAHRNIVAGALIANDSAASTENLSLGVTLSDKDSFAKYQAAFGSGRDFAATTFDSAIAAFTKDDYGATAYWDFTTNAPKSGAPIPSRVALSSDVDEIVITYDQGLWLNGTVTLTTSSGATVAASVSAIGTELHIAPTASLSSGDYVITIPTGSLEGWFSTAPAEVIPISIEEPITAPSQITAWTVATGSQANEILITIAALPSDGGSAITDLQYAVDGGTWISLGSSSAGSYALNMAAAGVAYAIAVRAVNAIGVSPTSTAQSVTSGSEPGSWVIGDITATGATITSSPATPATPVVSGITQTTATVE